MKTNNKKWTWKDFLEHCREVEAATPIDINESEADKQNRIKRAKKDYQYFFEYYLQNYARIRDKNTKQFVKTECAWFHVLIAYLLINNTLFKGILEWFRGSAKSVHATLGYPLWLMINDEMKSMLLVGQNEDKANKLLASIQAQLRSNQRFKNDFGEQVRQGSWEKGEFVTQNGISFVGIGLGQSPRGTRSDEFRPDYIVCDDLDTKELCKNPKRVAEAVDFINEDVMGCFDGGFERFLLVNNRFSDTSILAKSVEERFVEKDKLNTKKLKSLLKSCNIEVSKEFDNIGEDAYSANQNGDWFWLRIDACDDNCTPTWWQKYNREHWANKQNSTPLRSWYREYRNRAITEGKVFKKEWIDWKKIPKLQDFDHLIAYCDPSYKNTKTSDHKAIKFWGKINTKLYLIKAFNRKCSISTMVKAFYDLHQSLPSDVICDYYMEANFLQDLMLDDFVEEGELRKFQLPIRPDYRSKPDKYSRIEATSPLYERGHIIYNEDERENPDMKRAIEHLIAFEQGSNTPDDSMDADEGAIFILQQSQRISKSKTRIGQRKSKSY